MNITKKNELIRKERIQKVENTIRTMTKNGEKEEDIDYKEFTIYLSDELSVSLRTASEYIKIAKWRIEHDKT
jgi:hypothetical protein